MAPEPAAAGGGVAPPADATLVDRINKLAGYVARNPAMEDHVRNKQASNPDFAFLNGGEGAEPPSEPRSRSSGAAFNSKAPLGAHEA